MSSKSRLAIMLSKLKVFDNPNPQLEQYPTDSEAAADILWNARLLGDIEGKSIADLGAGTGILGIGALSLLASKVYFVEVDSAAIKILKENLNLYEHAHIIEGDVSIFPHDVDTVVMNPPFGVQKRKADKPFLEKAFKHANAIYYLGKPESEQFLKSIAQEAGFRITHCWHYDFPLKQTMKFHTKKIRRMPIYCWRLVK